MSRVKCAVAAGVLGALFGIAPAVAQEDFTGHSAAVLCLRPLIPEKLIDLPLFNFPGGAIPAETQVFGFFMSDNAECPS